MKEEKKKKAEVYTVSCRGGRLKARSRTGAHTHPVNPSVSVLSSPTIHPFTRLYLCFSDEDKGKHSLICSISPHSPLLSPSLALFRGGSQA